MQQARGSSRHPSARRRSPEPQLQTEAPLAWRPDPDKGAALDADRPDEDAVAVCQPVASEGPPLVLAEHLDPVRLPPRPYVADLTPDDCPRPASCHLRERQL